MMRIERDPKFWTEVASHPAVAPALYGMAPETFGALAGRPDVLPVAGAHGGFLLSRIDALGFVAELHTLFTPEGWGREAHDVGMAMFDLAFGPAGFRMLTTFEVEGRKTSRPPRSAGFVAAGDWRASPLGQLRLWILTAEAFGVSPAYQRRAKCRLQ